jgi:hypothetical protein
VLEPELAPTLALLTEVLPSEEPERVEETIAADFDGEGTRVVDGWSLAATEVHFTALVALFGL